MRTIVWITLVTLAVTYGIVGFATLDRRDDQAQVKSLFAQAADAVQRRDLGDLIACVSTNYKDATEMNYEKLRMITAQALQADIAFTVDYTLKNVKIVGNTANAEVSLTVKSAGSGMVFYKRDLALILTKESSRHMLVIPTTEWKVTSIDGLGLEL